MSSFYKSRESWIIQNCVHAHYIVAALQQQKVVKIHKAADAAAVQSARPRTATHTPHSWCEAGSAFVFTAVLVEDLKVSKHWFSDFLPKIALQMITICKLCDFTLKNYVLITF